MKTIKFIFALAILITVNTVNAEIITKMKCYAGNECITYQVNEDTEINN